MKPSSNRFAFSLRRSRDFVRKIYEEHGYQVLSWGIDSAVPESWKTLRGNAPHVDVVLNIATEKLHEAMIKAEKKHG